MPYIIQRVDDGKFVATIGHERSYVKYARYARWFSSLAEANPYRCGNERVWLYQPEHKGQPESFHIPKDQGDHSGDTLS